MDELELECVFRGVDQNSCDASEWIIGWLGTYPGYFVQERLREHFGNCPQCRQRTPELESTYREMESDRNNGHHNDECHRCSSAADSAWREILDHFQSATQIGLTATPKETEHVSCLLD